MKKILLAIATVLALNFLAAAGGVGWLFKTGHLDRAKVLEVKKLVFPPPAPTTAPASEAAATTQPSSGERLEELLSKASGRSAVEQVEFIRQTFDTQVAQLDRRERELSDLQRQVDLSKQQMSQDRAKLLAEQQELAAREQEQTKLASDKGFQDSLALYTSIPPKQVKTIFMTLNDDVVQRYLEAMPAKTAAKIMKEFKAPEEVNRIQRVLEKMRQAAPTPTPAPTGVAATGM